jgi:Uma2 family endonuclease
MSTVPKRWLSPQEYLAQERLADFRSEYYRGETFAMAGGSPRHSLIKANTVAELRRAVRGGPCRVYDSDLKILVSANGLFTYPDASVICGKVELSALDDRTATNPAVLAEVLSESSEAYDRGKKFDLFSQIPSLRHYLLISQDSPAVEVRSRNVDGGWTPNAVSGLDAALDLQAIGVTISLAEIYLGVEFPETSSGMPALPS